MWKVLVLVVICCPTGNCECKTVVDELCYQILPKDYEIFRAPDDKGNPINVYVGFQVLDVDEIDESKMDFRLHAFVTSTWNDSRLQLDQHKLNDRLGIVYEKCRHYFWTPDIFFERAKAIEVFESTSPTTILKVFPDGAIIQSTRFSFKSGCHMNFENYPFDRQTCIFLVSLMTSSDSVARLQWIENSSYGIPSVKMMREAHPLQFSLKHPTTDSITEMFVEGNYTSLVVNFVLVRRLTGSIMSTFAPSTMIVMMSWVSFWLKVDAVPARVALSVTSLLTLCTQVDQYRSQLPPVNYIKAMDIWLFVCIVMVFSTLLVFAVSYNISSRKCKECKERIKAYSRVEEISSSQVLRKKVKLSSNPLDERWGRQAKSASSPPRMTSEFLAAHKECQMCHVNKVWGHRVDEVCKLLFPGLFFIFACVYWTHYLSIYKAHW